MNTENANGACSAASPCWAFSNYLNIAEDCPGEFTLRLAVGPQSFALCTRPSREECEWFAGQFEYALANIFRAATEDFREDALSQLSYLASDLQLCEERGDKYVIYHHDCMSGTSCDACRIFGRIGDLVRLFSMPNAKLTGPTPEPVQRTDVDGSGLAPCWALPSTTETINKDNP